MSNYYVGSPAGVNGTCLTQKYTGNGEEHFEIEIKFDLKLKKGWNLIKYAVEELHTDKNGKVYASAMKYQSIDEMPDGTVFAFFED